MIIIQPKRLLISKDAFNDSYAERKFFTFVEVRDLNLFAEETKSWYAAVDVEYDGKVFTAVPRRFNTDFLSSVLDINDRIRDDYTWDGRKVKFDFTGEPRDERQKEIFNFLTRQGKYSNITGKRSSLFAETGIGKTFLTLKTIAFHQSFTYIHCPDERALTTWKEEILKFTDIQETEIAIARGKDALPRILKNRDKYKIVLGSSMTMSAAILRNDFSFITEFFEEMGFECIVYDEIHLHLMTIFYLEMLTQIPYTLYLSATPDRRVFKETKILESLLPGDKYTFDIQPRQRFNLIKLEYWSNLEKKQQTGIVKPTGFCFPTYTKKVFKDSSAPRFDFYMNEVILKSVKYLLKKRSSSSSKVVIVGKTKLDNEIILNFLQGKLGDEYTYGLFNSSIEDKEERFAQREADIIISTDKSLAGIINIKNLEHMLNLMPISSSSHVLQIIGRIRDEPIVEPNGNKVEKNSYIIQPVDMSFKKMRSIFSGQIQSIKHILNNETYETIKLNDRGAIEEQE